MRSGDDGWKGGDLMQWLFPQELFDPAIVGTVTNVNRSTVTPAGYFYRRPTGAGTGQASFGAIATGDLPAGVLVLSGGVAPVAGSLTVSGNIIASGTQNQMDSLGLKSGANKSCGTVTLVGGTMTVSNTRVTAGSIVLVGIVTDGGTPGAVRVSAKVAGTSFSIASSSALDTSVVGWVIVEPY